MKRVIFTVIALLVVFVASAKQYAFSGESLSLYDNTCKHVVDQVPSGVTVVVTSDVGTSWVRVRTNTTPVKSGWVQKQNLYEVEVGADGNIMPKKVEEPHLPAWKERVADFLQENESSPILRLIALVILLCLLPISLAIGVSIIAFLVLFVFKFEALREWFNKKAGMDIVPDKRLDKRLLWWLVFAGVIIAGALIISDMPDATVPVVVAIIACFILVARWRMTKLGSGKAACLEMIYIALAGYTALLLGVFFFWLIIIVLGLKILASSGSSSGKGSSGEGGYIHTCRECAYFSDDGCGGDWCNNGHGRIHRDDKICSAAKL